MTERALPFGRPQVWGWLFASPFVIAFGVFASRGRAGAAAAAAGAAIAWMASAMVRRADRHRVRNVAVIGAALTLLTTWMSATVVAYAVAGDHPLHSSWVTIWLVAAPNIGGLLALFRSVQTRAETSATLHELSGLRVSALSAPLLQIGVQTRFARTVDDVIVGLENMIQLAVGLRVLPDGVDRASVWAKDDDRWFICASTSLTARGQAFTQPVLGEPAAGAGIVANFAGDFSVPEIPGSVLYGDVLLVGSHVNDHPWFAANPAETRRSEGIAVVRLRRAGKVVGALCLTSAGPAIPVVGSRAEEVIDILTRWAQAFGIAIASLYAVRDARDTSHEGHQAELA